MWAYFLIASTVLFKWTDSKGNLFVTDKLSEVPEKYRAAFAKQLEEREKKKPKPAPEAPPPPASDSSAYAKYMERLKDEKATREAAGKLRDAIGEARARIGKLEEEYGTLASNPVLNAAQPIRKERMAEIEKSIEDEKGKIGQKLGELKQMIVEGKPEQWVTGLD